MGCRLSAINYSLYPYPFRHHFPLLTSYFRLQTLHLILLAYSVLVNSLRL
jgi:hypothetical protein